MKTQIIMTLQLQNYQEQKETSSQDLIQKGIKSDSEAIECDISSENSRLRLKMIALERAYDIEILVNRKVKGYEFPVDVIFSIIYENYKRKGMSRSGLDYIREIFSDPKFDIYKSGIYSRPQTPRTLKQVQTSSGKDKLLAGEIESSDNAVKNAIAIIEQNLDHPLLREKLPKYYSIFDKEARKLKALEKELDTFRIVKPEPRETSLSDVLGEIHQLSGEAQKRVIAYPPSKEDDAYLANGLSILRDYMRSLADLKHSRSIFSWFGIVFEKHSQSTHSAMSKSKILSIMGEVRKVTREQIDAKDPVLITLASKIVDIAPFLLGQAGYAIREVFEEMIDTDNPALIHVAIKAIEMCIPLMTMDIYKDKYQAPFTADFHIRRHDKLSESAFGNASLN